MDRALELVGSVVFTQGVNYFGALLGAFTVYGLSLNRGFDGFVPFLRRMDASRSDEFYFRVDFVLSLLVGPLVALGLQAPPSFDKALLAGLMWVGTIRALMGEKRRS